MNYMDHYQKVGDLVTLLGDFPLVEGELTRREKGFFYKNGTVEVSARDKSFQDRKPAEEVIDFVYDYVVEELRKLECRL